MKIYKVETIFFQSSNYLYLKKIIDMSGNKEEENECIWKKQIRMKKKIIDQCVFLVMTYEWET